MTTYAPIKPTISGVDCGPAKAAAASDKISAVGKLMIVIENVSLASITCTLEDAQSVQPEGAAASSTFADLILTCPASDRIAAIISNPTRFRDPTTGLIALTWSATTDVTWTPFEIS